MAWRDLRPTDRVRITFVGGCDEGVQGVVLPIRFEPPQVLTRSTAFAPAGIAESEPTVYFQAVTDLDGNVQRAVYLGGPESLIAVARESLKQWRVQPIRVNGAPVVNPFLLQITVR